MSKRKIKTVHVRVIKDYVVIEYQGFHSDDGWIPDVSTRTVHNFRCNQVVEMPLAEANQRIRQREVELI